MGAQTASKEADSQYMGKMNLPPAEQNVETTDGQAHSGAAVQGQEAPGQPGQRRMLVRLRRMQLRLWRCGSARDRWDRWPHRCMR